MFRPYYVLLDVDGTITPARQKISEKMYSRIITLALMRDVRVYLVTGSNIEKTIEQCTTELVETVNGTFACSGNAFYAGTQRVFMNYWEPPSNVLDWLQSELSKSPYTNRTGNHIERRPGSINFSVVGRNADMKQRIDYKYYDNVALERHRIVNRFNEKFPTLSATVGGDTGIDIGPKGNDKSQVFKYLSPLLYDSEANGGTTPVITFIGDRMSPGGNDEPLKTIIEASWPPQYCECVSVTGLDETYEKLGKLYQAMIYEDRD